MEVILLEKIAKLGSIGARVEVKDGFARNFLFPRGKALRANKANIAYFEAQQAEIEKANQERKAAAEASIGKFEGLEVTIVRQASEDGKLYGAV
ncbi:MAG: 50S ribosomal protein L9, partial [Candidatus Jidaibacter sp.]|nr:50S ribosomal protein L9 [Candidatus Jidaibacter sp.]